MFIFTVFPFPLVSAETCVSLCNSVTVFKTRLFQQQRLSIYKYKVNMNPEVYLW